MVERGKIQRGDGVRILVMKSTRQEGKWVVVEVGVTGNQSKRHVYRRNKYMKFLIVKNATSVQYFRIF